jgi:riboflavin synthase
MVFSGIVEGTAVVSRITKKIGLYRLEIETPKDFSSGLQIGGSVCVDGVCLTTSSIDSNRLGFDVMMETLDVTTLNLIKENDIVNIERSIKLGDEIGGHLVSGHVSDIVTICQIEKPENNHVVTFQTSSEVIQYIFPKGYVALNGVSLTIGEVNRSDNSFNVYLIPETLRLTNLGEKVIGDSVNLEIETQTRNMVDTISVISRKTING